jgi:hypothetical protein
MAGRYLNIRLLFPLAALVLWSVRLFAPLSETWGKIFGWAAIAAWAVYIGIALWEDWRRRQMDQSSDAGISSGDQM